MKELMSAPDSLKGYMYKKSPHPMRFWGTMDWRYICVEDMQLTWWKSEDEANASLDMRRAPSQMGRASTQKPDDGAKGFINFGAQCVELTIEKGNATTLTLKPKSGTWVDGAIGKGDKGRG